MFFQRKLLITSLLSIMVLVASAQNGIMDDIKDKEYQDAYEDLQEDYEERDVFYNYLYATLYNERGFTFFNTEKAIEYLNKAEGLYEQAGSEEKKDLRENEYPVRPSELRNLRIRICGNALEKYKETNTIESYEQFLSTYERCEQYRAQAENSRNELAYELVIQQGTLESYQGFIESYPEAYQTEEITYLRDSMLYEKARVEDNREAYQSFIRQYPESPFVSKAQEALGALDFQELLKENDEKKLVLYLEKNPQSTHRNQVESRIYELATADGEGVSYSRFIRNYPTSHKITDACKKLYHMYYDFDGELYSLQKFSVFYENCPDFPELRKAREKAELAFQLGLTAQYNNYGGGVLRDVDPKFYKVKIRSYIRQTGDVELAWVALQRIMKQDLENGNWQSALDTLNAYKKFFTDKELVEKISKVEAMLKIKDPKIIRQKLGPGINTDGHEYIPVISFDGKHLFFCAKQRQGNIGGEDVFVASRKEITDAFGQASLFPDINSKEGNESPLSLSADGTRLLVFKNGDIYESKKTATGWEQPVRLPEPLNTEKWEADAMYSSDGKAIVFASSRLKGYNIHLDAKFYHGLQAHHSDLYVCLYEDDKWSQVINLGEVLNTPYSERQPYLHPDMKTLYFSSDGHYGLGGLDVYKTERLYDTSWTHWSDPVNLGKAINTPDGDWGYKINTTGEHAYYFSNETGSYDIFRVELPESMRPQNVAMIHGVVRNQDGEPVHTELRWEDLVTGEEMGFSNTDPEDGSFFIILPLNRNYGYFVNHQDYFPEANSIDLRQEKRMVTREENIELTSLESMFADGKSITIDNVFFEHDKDELKPESFPQLDRLAELIQNLPGMVIEISGHTDNTGNDAYNMDLSARRAAAVRDYLIVAGCDETLLKSEGYGETRPIATNDTEEGRALNRRVEFGMAEE